jgi:hypothetical protein
VAELEVNVFVCICESVCVCVCKNAVCREMASACSFFSAPFSSLFMASDSRYMHKKDCERAEIYTGLTTMLALCSGVFHV